MCNCHCSIDACSAWWRMLHWFGCHSTSTFGRFVATSFAQLNWDSNYSWISQPWWACEMFSKLECWQSDQDRKQRNKTLSLNWTVPGDLEKTLQAGRSIEDCRIEHFTLVCFDCSAGPSYLVRITIFCGATRIGQGDFGLKLISKVGRRVA